MDFNEGVLKFWDERSEFGKTAGSNDFVLSGIEQEFICEQIPQGSRVLDLGCGNGGTVVRLAQEKGCTCVGVDFSAKMAEVASAAVVEAGLQDAIEIHNTGVPPVPDQFGTFDVVVSERCLINLSSSEKQRKAVQGIEGILNPGGKYLMVECSQQGGDRTNEVRQSLGLYPIEAPWHNLFFDEREVEQWQSDNFKIEDFQHISSTYNFLSRVVYAKLAEQSGEELKYDSDINILSTKLPPMIGDFGPVKAWVWRKS